MKKKDSDEVSSDRLYKDLRLHLNITMVGLSIFAILFLMQSYTYNIADTDIKHRLVALESDPQPTVEDFGYLNGCVLGCSNMLVVYKFETGIVPPYEEWMALCAERCENDVGLVI